MLCINVVTDKIFSRYGDMSQILNIIDEIKFSYLDNMISTKSATIWDVEFQSEA